MNQQEKSPVAQPAANNQNNFPNQSVVDGQPWVACFSVVHAGSGDDRLLPIAPYARFRTESEAEIFRDNALPTFPACKIAKEIYDAEVVSDTLFHPDFVLAVETDDFAPRAKRGNTLLMRQGIEADDGDLVAVGRGDSICTRIDFYRQGLGYFAVAVAIMNTRNALAANGGE
jgi:hypothetical protein